MYCTPHRNPSQIIYCILLFSLLNTMIQVIFLLKSFSLLPLYIETVYTEDYFFIVDKVENRI